MAHENRMSDHVALGNAARSYAENGHLPLDSASGEFAALAKSILDARRQRDASFPGDMGFGEPTWDMLLDLYVQHVCGRQEYVSSLCTAAAVPTTTALRWISQMVEAGYFLRQRDPVDRRRTLISLAPATIEMVERYLGDVRRRRERLQKSKQ